MVTSYIIKKPIITEKSLADAQNGIFTFKVDRDATKIQLKEAIEKMFNVHVQAITTAVIKGKKRFVGRRRQLIYQSSIKKARVKLAPSEKIDLFEVRGEK